MHDSSIRLKLRRLFNVGEREVHADETHALVLLDKVIYSNDKVSKHECVYSEQ